MIDARQLVTVAPVTTPVCNLGAEVELDPQGVGLDAPSVVNGDGIHTIEQRALTGPLGIVADDTMRDVCAAVGYALGC